MRSCKVKLPSEADISVIDSGVENLAKKADVTTAALFLALQSRGGQVQALTLDQDGDLVATIADPSHLDKAMRFGKMEAGLLTVTESELMSIKNQAPDVLGVETFGMFEGASAGHCAEHPLKACDLSRLKNVWRQSLRLC